MVRRPVRKPERNVLNQNLLLITDAVTVVINERTQMRRMHQIQPVVIPHRPTRTVHIRHIQIRLIRTTIPIQILQADDRTPQRLPVQ